MLNKDQVSNLITFYNTQIDAIKRYGSDDELAAFGYHFDRFLECIECDPIFEENHLVDIVEW